MGCDIHLHVEALQSRLLFKDPTPDDEWLNIDHFKINHHEREDKENPEYEFVPLYRERNYRLFGILANVRNYRELNECISLPKGFPKDASYVTKSFITLDDHSYSYFTLHELLEYYRDNMLVLCSGYVSPANDKVLSLGGEPSSWSEGSNLPGHVYREWTVQSPLSDLITKIVDRALEAFYAYDAKQVINKYSKSIRIVFWFDN